MNEVIDIFDDNPIIYTRFLSRFKDNFKDKGTQLLEKVNNLDFDAATDIAHTIKGSTAQIGALQLSNSAAIVEKLCREQDPDVLQHVQLTVDLLDEVLQGIECYFQKTS